MRNYILLFITGLFLQACNSAENKNHAADSAAGKMRVDTSINKTPISFKGLYAFGNEVNTFEDCRASEYENVLVVTEITKLEPKNFRTDCYNYEFIALGNEPFWSLEIIPAEKRIVLKDMGMEKVQEFIYKSAVLGEGLYQYEVRNPKNEKLVVIIRKEKCSDGMSDRQYNYSVEISLNGRILKGCAIKKGEVFNDRP